jgi:pyridinium-3,5-biscarboxylic acid mononucleotide synthase
VRHPTLSAMRPEELRALLTDMAEGNATVEDALNVLRRLPVEDLGFARLDVHRELRQGFPEAIYAEGKTPDQVLAIASRMLESTSGAVLATRVSPETATALRREFPTAAYHERARLVVLRSDAGIDLGTVTVVAAGTSDIAVAEEAAAVATALGALTDVILDVGVAGLHRLLSVQDRLMKADVVIVVAGMEGALASLVGGITPAPVVAVPTSVGYGSSFDGMAALLAMLNSCAAGITVVNIDNGFGAAVSAIRILRTRT